MAILILKDGKEKSVLLRHPWVFANAIREIRGHADPGDIVKIADKRGNILASGFYNPASSIRVRLFWWGNQTVPTSYFQTALNNAVKRRAPLAKASDTNAYRLVFSESDFLPGLIVDRYADVLVLQTLNPGMERLKETLAGHLMELLHPIAVIEKNDADTRKLEGLPVKRGILKGVAPDGPIEILENGHRFLVDLDGGQKTGFYLDQRENRALVARYAEGKTLLDAFSYTGGFSVYAAAAKATRLTRVDTSREALESGKRNLTINGLDAIQDEAIRGNVFQVLRGFRDRGRQFGMIVLDPPKLAATKAHRDRAIRGYKDINLLALKLLKPGGTLATFSCSGGIDADTFVRTLSWAAKDARREVQILHRLHQGPDHPVLLSFPEAAYLKGLFCRVL